MQVLTFDENDVDTSIERMLALTKGCSGSKEIVTNPNIPYSVKAGNLKTSAPVETALGLLQDSNSASQLVLSSTNINESEFVLDIHGCLYFSILDLVDSLLQSGYQLCVSPQTYELLTDWRSSIEKNKGKDGGVGYPYDSGLALTTNETIFTSTSRLRGNLEKLLSQSKIVRIQPVDFSGLTNDLLLLDVFDISLTSSVKVAYSNNLPLFCLDPMLVSALQTELKIASSNHIFSTLIDSASYDARNHWLVMFAIHKLPILFRYEDLYRLLLSRNIDDVFIVGSVIEGMEFQLDVCLNIFSHSINFLVIRFDKNYYNHCYSRIIYRVLQKVISERSLGKIAEERLANFTAKTYTRLLFKKSNVFEYFIKSFIQGHFLSIKAFNFYIEEINKKIENAQNTPPDLVE